MIVWFNLNLFELNPVTGTKCTRKMKMGFSQSIEKKIENKLNPVSLEIINESHLHAGHQESFDGSGETHLRIKIVTEAFEGMSRVDRHRAINALIDDEIAAGLHAIAIEAKAPSEVK
jgi:BolA protein